MLEPSRNRAGRRAVITVEEEQLIKDRMKFIASRGFAMDARTLCSVMAAIAADGRKGFENGVQSGDVIRAFRARNRDITFRNAENKDQAKLRGENYDHVKTYADALQQVQAANPGIFEDGDRLWNMDETAVDAEFGQLIKLFGPSNTHHGGFRASPANAGGGKHLTAVVVTSASGRCLPPFFIFAGKNVMSSWFEPLPGEIFKDGYGHSHWLTSDGWFPRDAALFPSQNGSMEMYLMLLLMEHIDRNVRNFLPRSKTFALCLDGHSSRNGFEWLELCVSKGCEVIQSPANTSHFLQPCDASINKCFKAQVRKTRDELCEKALIDTRSMSVKLMVGVAGYRELSGGVVQSSFSTTGLWPMNYRFMKRFETQQVRRDTERSELVKCIQNSGPGARLPSVLKRRTDASTLKKLQGVLHSEEQSSKAIAKLSCILNENKTVSSILFSVARPGAMNTTGNKRVLAGNSNTSLECGTPAMYLTHREMIAQRREKEDAAAREKARKEQEKKEKYRLRLEAIKVKEKEKAQRALQREQRAKDAAKAKAERAAASASKKRERKAINTFKSAKLRKMADTQSGNADPDARQQAALAMMELHGKES